MRTKTALVVGATGLVGHELINLMLHDYYYTEITVIVRRPLEIRHPKLKQHIVDFDNIDSYKELIKADDVYCCLGTTIKKAKSKDNFYKVDYTYPTELARLARFNGACTFSIITAMGSNKLSSIFYNRVKGEVEEMVAKLQFKSCNIFRPSLLLGERDEFRLGEEIGKAIAKGMDIFMIGNLKKYKPIKATAVAFAMLHLTKQAVEGINIYESNQLQEVYDEDRFGVYQQTK